MRLVIKEGHHLWQRDGLDVAAIMARRDMEAELLAKGGTPGDGRSDHRRTAKDTRALSDDEDPDKITVGNFLQNIK